MELTQYKIDTNASDDGKWFPISDAKFKLVSLSSIRSKNFRRQNEKVLAPYHRSGLPIPEEVSEDNLFKMLSQAIILDWENVKEGGVEVPFSSENAYRLIKTYPILAEAISSILQDLRSFVDEKAYSADSAKN